MNAEPQEDSAHRTALVGLFAIGLLLLGMALQGDPVGQDPESGLVALSPTQARQALGVAGVAFVAAGLWSWWRSARGR